jgi:hypothetical protein
MPDSALWANKASASINAVTLNFGIIVGTLIPLYEDKKVYKNFLLNIINGLFFLSQ